MPPSFLLVRGNWTSRRRLVKRLLVLQRWRRAYNIPVIAIAGGIGEGAEAVYEAGIDAMLGIVQEPMSLEGAVEDADTVDS